MNYVMYRWDGVQISMLQLEQNTKFVTIKKINKTK